VPVTEMTLTAKAPAPLLVSTALSVGLVVPTIAPPNLRAAQAAPTCPEIRSN